ncbi:hypothetical protein EDEG_01662 [Edhazardia aedis USNM 41457]|uniref:Uncharacterized protein n=1 Tax=Edhazardia aedis (strain USNM 41457) TaxID=1003232 RepID=J8ZWG0_EDHAE|nr:hypothetical protein EDEG_01662 [Edhazardia aedis USNM 41457]|eukprot:EJW04028.1 hypothetical protein EDEG_01662 [Edhazardia aedis USNM 41457]
MLIWNRPAAICSGFIRKNNILKRGVHQSTSAFLKNYKYTPNRKHMQRKSSYIEQRRYVHDDNQIEEIHFVILKNKTISLFNYYLHSLKSPAEYRKCIIFLINI